MAWDLYIAVLMLVLGAIYGYTKPGKENRVAILKKAFANRSCARRHSWAYNWYFSS
ncbi:MAG: hypothetical protein QFX36_07630 [Archaeoglobales archaeon]|nr:hypothetical protein [Archaeoglobales archaeon]